MERLLNVVWSGLWIGSEYAAIGAALVVNYRVARVVDVTTGQVFVFGALLAATLQGVGLPPWAGVLVAVALGAAVLAAQDVLLLQRLRDPTPGRMILVTVGVTIALSGLSVVLFGRDPLSGAGPAPPGGVALGTWRGSWNALAFIGGTTAAILLAWLFVQRSPWGKAMFAAGHDPQAAAMIGINVPLLRILANLTSGALLGLAGALFLPLGVVDFSMGLRLTLFGFVAAALSGYHSLPAALLVGWLFGVIDALGTTYVSSESGLVITFTVLIALALATQWVRAEHKLFEAT